MRWGGGGGEGGGRGGAGGGCGGGGGGLLPGKKIDDLITYKLLPETLAFDHLLPSLSTHVPLIR